MRLITYDVMMDEAWTRMREAGDDPAHPMRLVVLATGTDDGSPDARVMVLRGANRDLGRLWFYTDLRSAKVDQIRAHPTVCVVASDRDLGIQIRARGTASVDASGTLVERHWGQVSMSLQALFAMPDPPGCPFASPDPRLAGMKRSIERGQGQVARANFSVIEVKVSSIEWLQVFDDEQRRAIAVAANGWAVQALAP